MPPNHLDHSAWMDAFFAPYYTFWFRFVAPLADRLRAGQIEPMHAWKEHIEPNLESYVNTRFPLVAQQHLKRRAAARLGAEARVVGGL